jgi:competence protein ComEC
VLRVKTVDAIETVSFEPSFFDRLQNQRRELRNNALDVLERSVAPETARVAEAFLLGSRQQLPDDLRQAFMESGTLHVLAISGVNVGVIWLGLVRACRTIGWSRRQTGWTVIGGLLLYVWLTDANPPIVRAVMVAIVFQVAELLNRQVNKLQGLSLALLVVLVANPLDLFHPGAQLSFISVSALSAAQQWWDRWMSVVDEATVPSSALGYWARWTGLAFLQANVSTGAVWAVTLPLVAWRFHLVSFAGFFLNVLLGPLVCLLLWSGYLWLVCAAISPILSEVPLRVFEMTLQALIWLTEQTASWQCSHVYVAGPPDWWVLGYYLLLTFGALVVKGIRWKWLIHALLTWTNIGLAWTLFAPATSPGMVCEVLSVGHGLAVVTHCPNGRTLVYDAGSLIGPDVAAEAVCGSLWRHGQRHVDALVVSHADVDHCNGVPLVVDRTSADTLLAHRTFLDFSQVAVTKAVEAWTSRGGECRLIAAGDRVLLDPHVQIEILHPAADFSSKRDNSNSLVVRLQYAGRQILLTGDLERDGQAALLALPRQPADVLLAPHHGSRAANPPALGAWSHPTWVAISASDHQVEQRLADSFEPPVALLNTANRGMIRFEIHPDGEMIVTTFR